MPAPSPTVSELFKAKAASDDEVDAAVVAFLAGETGAYPIAEGFTLDLSAAVAGHRWASEVVADPEAGATLKRGAVRTAILLAWAEKA